MGGENAARANKTAANRIKRIPIANLQPLPEFPKSCLNNLGMID